MKLEIEKPDLMKLEMKCLTIIHRLQTNNTKDALSSAVELRGMIEAQRQLLTRDWKDLLFKLANTL